MESVSKETVMARVLGSDKERFVRITSPIVGEVHRVEGIDHRLEVGDDGWFLREHHFIPSEAPPIEDYIANPPILELPLISDGHQHGSIGLKGPKIGDKVMINGKAHWVRDHETLGLVVRTDERLWHNFLDREFRGLKMSYVLGYSGMGLLAVGLSIAAWWRMTHG